MLFTKVKHAPFYTSPTGGNNGFTGFLLYDTGAPQELSFTDCFNTYKGYFIFLATSAVQDAFIQQLQNLLPEQEPAHTQLAWIHAEDPGLATAGDLTLLQLNADGIQQNDVTGAWGKYTISIPAGSTVTTDVRGGVAGLSWTLSMEEVYPQPQPFFLPFEGKDKGLLITRASIADFSDQSDSGWDVGFRYFMPLAGTAEIVSQYYPLFQPEKNRNILFKLLWDFCSSKRTTLAFEELSFEMKPSPEKPGAAELHIPEQPGLLRTWLRTDMGLPVYLYPLNESIMPGQGAKLVLSALPGNDYYWTPEGSFELNLADDNAQPATYYLLCGLSGVETMNFQPRNRKRRGDVLLFESGQPAYVYNFPGVFAAPESLKNKKKKAPGAPADLYLVHSSHRQVYMEHSQKENAYPAMPRGAGQSAAASSYLDDRYKTSWIQIRSFTGASGSTNYYYAQPSTSPLYGGATGATGVQPYPAPGQMAASAYSFMPFFRPSSAILNDSGKPTRIQFPMVPFAGAVPGEQALLINQRLKSPPDFLSYFEEQVLAPSRTEQVMKNQQRPRKKLRAGAENNTSYSTSPQGLLMKIGGAEQDFQWQELLFAYAPADADLKGSVESRLAFEKLGGKLQAAFQKKQLFLVLSLLPKAEAGFKNEISIQGWPFRIDVPIAQQDGDYKNVLIFKFAAGSLEKLLKNPAEWTSAADFNADPADVSEKLLTYINEHRQQKAVPRKLRNSVAEQPSLYENFNRLITSETWTGVIALNVDLDLAAFPEQIKGLIGGIDIDRFKAHHFGIEVNQVVPDPDKGGLKFAEPSSLFGLIDYKGGTAEPVKPYDFKVDLLQVLFTNNTITDFRCKISLTLSTLFDEAVDFAPEPPQPSTINLSGTYEKHEGVATYSFLSDRQYTLSSKSGVVWKSIALSKIQFFTLSQQNATVNAVFSFWGNMVFNNVGQQQNFDLFSFDQLSFNGMQLLMSFDIPADHVTKPKLTFTFDPSAITFNNSVSVPRAASLFQNFPLEAKGMVFGDGKKLPSGKGYFKIELPLKNPDGITSVWYGLRYDLDLGTPGALAEKVGFTASILACWTPCSSLGGTHIAAYLQLPGSGGRLQTVLQNVLTLSIADAEFSSQEGDGKNPVYKLALKDIALKVLGMSLPPGGKTNASLFTNAGQQGKKDSVGWYIAYNKK